MSDRYFRLWVAVLVSRFPEKGPELWAYQSTILNAAHSYEGATWVAYDTSALRAGWYNTNPTLCFPQGPRGRYLPQL